MENNCCKLCGKRASGLGATAYVCIDPNCPNCHQQPAEDARWQKIFLNAGTANGFGDLSMMISVVSKIIAQAQAEKANEIINDIPDEMKYEGKWTSGRVDLKELKQALKAKHLTNPK